MIKVEIMTIMTMMMMMMVMMMVMVMAVMTVTLKFRLEVELSVYCQDCHLQDFQRAPWINFYHHYAKLKS